MLTKIGFDLAQVMIDNEKSLPSFNKKTFSSNSNMEKENYETNLYNHWLMKKDIDWIGPMTLSKVKKQYL